jgi:hypothetical protein
MPRQQTVAEPVKPDLCCQQQYQCLKVQSTLRTSDMRSQITIPGCRDVIDGAARRGCSTEFRHLGARTQLGSTVCALFQTPKPETTRSQTNTLFEVHSLQLCNLAIPHQLCTPLRSVPGWAGGAALLFLGWKGLLPATALLIAYGHCSCAGHQHKALVFTADSPAHASTTNHNSFHSFTDSAQPESDVHRRRTYPSCTCTCMYMCTCA